MLAVTLSKDAWARAVQLPAWKEALGLPRPWDQQWSLRMQQVLAFESDLLEHDDLFEGSVVVEAKVAEIADGARAGMQRVQDAGGAVAAIESGYRKSALVVSHSLRRQRMEAGLDVVVGVSRLQTTEPSPLTADLGAAVQLVDPHVEQLAVKARKQWRDERDADPERCKQPAKRLRQLVSDASSDANLMTATLGCAWAGVTTGSGRRRCAGCSASTAHRPASAGRWGRRPGLGEDAGRALAQVRDLVRRTGDELGGRLRLLVGKPGLDGHSNGPEQVAVRARDAGFEMVYQGIRLTPSQIVAAAVAEDVHYVGLPVLSGSHLQVVPAVLEGLRPAGAGDVPVVLGAIIPPADEAALRALGVAAVFTAKDAGLTELMGQIVGVILTSRGLPPLTA